MGARTISLTGGDYSEKQAANLRYALLSVYYGSLGRELSTQGAPAMMLPLPVRPLDLRAALIEIRDTYPAYFRDAVWRVVRSVVPPQRYPAALADVLAYDAPPLSELDRLRLEYRGGTGVFAEALRAKAEGRATDVPALAPRFESEAAGLSKATTRILGKSAYDYVSSTDAGGAARAAKLRDELNMNLTGVAEQLADAGAFLDWWEQGSGAKGSRSSPSTMTVFPASSVVTQDVDTLVTEITVTALVQCGDFETVRRSVDPQCWACASDVVIRTRYVDDCFGLKPAPPERPARSGRRTEEPRLLEEDVTVSWGLDTESVGSFHNVLCIDKYSERRGKSITIEFSLARSIDSRIMWDQRGGGILVDQGFIKVRHIIDDRWRVSSRKTILFSDRAPNTGGAGFLDFGQMLNYLAPAALTWWLESELYSASNDIYSDPERIKACVAKQTNGSG